jgi:endonuclease G
MRHVVLGLALSLSPAIAVAQPCPDLSAFAKARLIEEHVFGGLPSEGDVLVRRGYVLSYDDAHRVPRWAAWHASPDYRSIPDRDVSRWGSFHEDPDLTNPVEDDDYNGLYNSEDNFARGHIVPYYISGGDRDRDGQSAADAEGDDLADLDDACTVFEIMYMSNIAPQYHYDFNGSGGLWYELESDLRELIDDQGASFHIIAGSIFGDDIQYVGPEDDRTIGVPDMFFKIVITDQGPIGFLFAHRRQLVPEACPLEAELVDCIVPISVIEAASGLDVFNAFAQLEDDFEAIEGRALWHTLQNPPSTTGEVAP